MTTPKKDNVSVLIENAVKISLGISGFLLVYIVNNINKEISDIKNDLKESLFITNGINTRLSIVEYKLGLSNIKPISRNMSGETSTLNTYSTLLFTKPEEYEFDTKTKKYKII